MNNKPKHKPYSLPSQQILDIINKRQQSEAPMSPFDASMLVSLAILDKLEVIAMTLRAMLPKREENVVKLPEKDNSVAVDKL